MPEIRTAQPTRASSRTLKVRNENKFEMWDMEVTGVFVNGKPTSLNIRVVSLQRARNEGQPFSRVPQSGNRPAPDIGLSSDPSYCSRQSGGRWPRAGAAVLAYG